MLYKIWNGASAIVIKDYSVLMVRANNSISWGVPSGEVEDDETAKETCIREVFEETAYKAEIVKEIHTKNSIIKDYKVTPHHFLCEIIGGKLQYHDPDEEIEEISWKNNSEISTIIHNYPEDKEIIEQLLLNL
ncbi:NUDIX hydrolase [Lysinibacillus sp. 54212]|uniref:NUDIX hydrolase n=1 Tax=Lysinibacillus sp. 54212 TaxID=3119829 RepID=UPI002FC7380C